MPVRQKTALSPITITVRNGLPQSHRIVTTSFNGQPVTGVVWQKQHINPEPDIINLYTHWPDVHFGAGAAWYEMSSDPVTNHAATGADVDFIQDRILEHNLNQTVVDVSCGAGRHSLLLKERGVREVIGMEPVAEQLKIARIRALDMSHRGFEPPVFTDTSRAQQAAYAGRADVVLFLFNSFGYTFNPEDDQQRLGAMARLLKPGGVLAIDVRGYKHQKQQYGAKPVTVRDTIHGSQGDVAYVTTIKHCPGDILASIEHIEVSGRTAQHMSLGWRLYSEAEMTKRIDSAGCTVIAVVPSRYTPEGELGERTWFLALRQ